MKKGSRMVQNIAEEKQSQGPSKISTEKPV